MTYLLICLVILCLLFQIFVFYKVRKIHIISLRLAEASNETLVLYQQLQSYDGLMRLIQPTHPLPPLRMWAASPDFLLVIARHARATRPGAILECSSGSSTLVLARCCELNGTGHVYSLENDEHFASETRERLNEQGLDAWATVIHAPLVPTQENGQPWYDLSKLPPDLPNFDMLVIDGPPALLGPLARYPALPKLDARMAEGATVFVDDAKREDEQRMLERWASEFPYYTQTRIRLEKGGALLTKTSENKEGHSSQHALA